MVQGRQVERRRPAPTQSHKASWRQQIPVTAQRAPQPQYAYNDRDDYHSCILSR